MNAGKILTYAIVIFLIGLSVYTAYGLLYQDCETNPPMVVSCDSTNLIDEGYSDCKLTQHEENNIIFPDKVRKYNCEYNGNRIEVEFERTKCGYSPSNLTADYRFCSS